MNGESETNIVSVERLQEYMHLPQEAPAKTEVVPPPAWPSRGKIEIRQLRARYRPTTPLVLKGKPFSFFFLEI